LELGWRGSLFPSATPLGGAAPPQQEQPNLPGEWEIFTHPPRVSQEKDKSWKKL